MTTLNLRSSASDLSLGGIGTFVMDKVAQGGSVVAIVLGPMEVQTVYWVCQKGWPGNKSWGTPTLTLDLSTMNTAGWTVGKMQFHRINTGGTIAESTGYTATQDITSDSTYPFTAPGFAFSGSGHCNDRLAVELHLTENVGGSASFDITVDDATSWTTHNIPVRCPAGEKIHFTRIPTPIQRLLKLYRRALNG